MTDKTILSNVATFDNSMLNVINANNAALTSAIDNTLSRDGTQPNQMGAPLDMNSFPILNLPAPGSPSSPARLEDVTGTIANLSLTVSLTGDATAPASSGALTTTVAKINGATLGTTTPTSGNILVGNGTQWGTTPITGVLSMTGGGVTSFNAGSINGSALSAGTVPLTAVASEAAYTTVGNPTSGSAVPVAMTQTQLTTLINPFTSSLSGAAPSSGGGTTNFLRADGTWALPPSAQTYQLLNTLTASSSANLSDTISITNTYSTYEIILDRVLPSTTHQILAFLVHAGGAFKNSGYLSLWSGQNPTTVLGPTLSVTTYIPITCPTTGSVDGAASNGAAGINGVIRIYNPSSSGYIMISADIKYTAYNSTTSTDLPALGSVSGYWNTAAVVDGFQLVMGSGNIASGTVKVYGIA